MKGTRVSFSQIVTDTHKGTDISLGKIWDSYSLSVCYSQNKLICLVRMLRYTAEISCSGKNNTSEEWQESTSSLQGMAGAGDG